MSDSLDDKIKEKLHSIFPNPAVANTVIDLAVNNKPAGWAKRSNAPYYKAFFGLLIKKDIDKMLESRNDIVYRYASWCGIEEDIMSKNTLYQRINQSIRYLVERMDTEDKKYAGWYELVNITREPGLGVCIRFIPDLRLATADQMKADTIIPRQDMPFWRQRLEDWLEGESDEPFCLTSLALSEDEVIKLRKELGSLAGIMANVFSHEIKIIRINV